MGTHLARSESENPTHGKLILSPNVKENCPARDYLSLSSVRKIHYSYTVVEYGV